jgi:GntR family transcriptional regulator/MocR family aminotransferase
MRRSKTPAVLHHNAPEETGRAMAQKLNAAMWKQLLQRSARDNMSLQGQIREMLVGTILDGQLPPGVPLPSSREMAEQLGVARNTVVLAYQQLADEGYLVSRERSGHFVNAEMLSGRLRAARKPAAPTDAPATEGPDWSRRLRLRPTQQRSIVKPADWQKYPYPFLYGQFPRPTGASAASRRCRCSTSATGHPTSSRATTTRWCSRSAPASCPGAACGPPPTRWW